MDRLLSVVQSAIFDMHGIRGMVPGAKDFQEVIQCDGEWMTVTNGFKKRILKKIVGAVGGEAVHYM